MGKEILIENVDVNLLEEQRQILNGFAVRRDVTPPSKITSTIMTDKEFEALEGVLNMLDSWSDKVYYEMP